MFLNQWRTCVCFVKTLQCSFVCVIFLCVCMCFAELVSNFEKDAGALQTAVVQRSRRMVSLSVLPWKWVSALECFHTSYKASERAQTCALTRLSVSLSLCRFRLRCQKFITHKMFDHIVLVFIFLNCITIALERPDIQPYSMVSSATAAPHPFILIPFSLTGVSKSLSCNTKPITPSAPIHTTFKWGSNKPDFLNASSGQIFFTVPTDSCDPCWFFNSRHKQIRVIESAWIDTVCAIIGGP